MRLRTGAAIGVVALSVASCGGTPAPVGPNGGCDGAWNGTQCVHEVVVAEVAPSASAPSTAPPPPPLPPPPPSTASAPTPPPPAAAAAVDRARDPRTSRVRPRALALLVTEVQQLEALANVTPDTQPDKPQIVRRLAEDYVEIEAAATSAGRAAIVASSREAAIRYYDSLASRFPTYPKLDEVLYFDALEHERAHDLNNARRLYYEVIRSSPSSRFVPFAYFAFGEFFAAEAASDPAKLDLALQAYQKVVASPPPTNTIYGWGWLRTGNVQDKKGNAAEARDAYSKAKEFATSYAQLPGSGDLLAALPP